MVLFSDGSPLSDFVQIETVSSTREFNLDYSHNGAGDNWDLSISMTGHYHFIGTESEYSGLYPGVVHTVDMYLEVLGCTPDWPLAISQVIPY